MIAFAIFSTYFFLFKGGKKAPDRVKPVAAASPSITPSAAQDSAVLPREPAALSVSHLPTVFLSVPLTLALSEPHSTVVYPKRSAFLSSSTCIADIFQTQGRLRLTPQIYGKFFKTMGGDYPYYNLLGDLPRYACHILLTLL